MSMRHTELTTRFPERSASDAARGFTDSERRNRALALREMKEHQAYTEDKARTKGVELVAGVTIIRGG